MPRDLIQPVLDLLPSGIAVALLIVGLVVAHRVLLRRARAVPGRQFGNQLILAGLTLVGALMILVVLPISNTLRGQLLSLVGIVLSAAIALSSTTLLGNALAGVTLRLLRNFRTGDFLRCGDHFGRVSARGLFHTEIQTIDRDLTTLPNLFLVTHPTTTVRASGTIVSATVSLGYDVPRGRIEELALTAAEKAGLEDPFMLIGELSDFSVSYRVCGLLREVKQLITIRSRLRGCLLDALHGGGVEIVSPSFMNQRVYATDQRFIPKRKAKRHDDTGKAESVVFDKADAAESHEALLTAHRKLGEELTELGKRIKECKEDDERARLERERDSVREHREHVQRTIEEQGGKMDEDE